ncbi:MAG: helix-turn-helix transcriptional regulator [Clostridia bacterium]|nr:helix-turn-helix transcriptional regulator [Clostridia bacterium]
MLIYDLNTIGNRLYALRKHMGMTQAELAEAAGLSDRTYADIERGQVNMRLETILRICSALYITPDTILTEETATEEARQHLLLQRLNACSPKDRSTALRLLEVFLASLD